MPAQREVSVLIADDHTLLREALREVLLAEGGFRVVGEACDGDSVVALASQTKPDVVLLDIGMPRNHPLTTVQRLHGVSPDSGVVILSMYDDPELVTSLLRAGVRGYLHKGVSRHNLFAAIRGARSDGQRVTISVSRESVTQAEHTEQPSLSSREREVLTLVSQAMSNRQIASQLSITEGTVKRHLRNIFDKLGAVSRIDAVNKAVAASQLVHHPQRTRRGHI